MATEKQEVAAHSINPTIFKLLPLKALLNTEFSNCLVICLSSPQQILLNKWHRHNEALPDRGQKVTLLKAKVTHSSPEKTLMESLLSARHSGQALLEIQVLSSRSFQFTGWRGKGEVVCPKGKRGKKRILE